MDIEDITQGGRRNHVILMDNNILASPYGLGQLEKIADKGYLIDLNQGNSARCVDADVADLLAHVRFMDNVIRFAADTPRQMDEVDTAMRLIDERRTAMGKAPAQYLIFTMITASLEEAYHRLSYWRTRPRTRITAQPYRDFNDPKQKIPQWQKDMARWAMHREYWTTTDFKQFSPRKGFVCGAYFKTNQQTEWTDTNHSPGRSEATTTNG